MLPKSKIPRLAIPSIAAEEKKNLFALYKERKRERKEARNETSQPKVYIHKSLIPFHLRTGLPLPWLIRRGFYPSQLPRPSAFVWAS